MDAQVPNHEAGAPQNLNQFREYRKLGLFLVVTTASVISWGTPEFSIARENVFMSFVLFLLEMILLMVSFVAMGAQVPNHEAGDPHNLNRLRDKYRELGLFLVVTTASVLSWLTPEFSIASENVFMSFGLFLLGMMLLMVSFVGN